MKAFATRSLPSFLLTLLLSLSTLAPAQGVFDYQVVLEPFHINGLPGLHSYAFAQHQGQWLIVGGRKDGLHARQPNSSFPSAQNNTMIYVVDPGIPQVWSASVNVLPSGIREQMQSTNMNFHQDGDTLVIIGGYAYSPTANDHITFPNLTTIMVSQLIQAIKTGQSILPWFKQISDPAFAVTGGRLGKIDNTYYLVGGHRFDGRYNPMGHATYVQAYTNAIRKFSISNSGALPVMTDFSEVVDPIHLRRRDYNLLPQIFPNASFGYTISSGVFQLTADLPFLYPVDITPTAHIPMTSFNQYLHHYHCATIGLFDSAQHAMHSLFFGGMSQYYYMNDNLLEDIQVPFVRTVSLLTRQANGSLHEYALPVEMPGYQGSASEFILNKENPLLHDEVVHLSQISADTILLGHIFGGILSYSLNPFSQNQTNTTRADSTVFAVRLIRQSSASLLEYDGRNPWEVMLFPNPVQKEVAVSLNMDSWKEADYIISSVTGQILQQGRVEKIEGGERSFSIQLNGSISPQVLQFTFIIDGQYYVSATAVKQ